MTKTYQELIDQANDTLADNSNKAISPADSRLMVTDHLDAQNNGTLIVRPEQGTILPVPAQAGRLIYRTDEGRFYVDNGTSWELVSGGITSWNEDVNGDIVPNAGDVGIGSADKPASHVAIGPADSVQGGIVERTDQTDGLGGLLVAGTDDVQDGQINFTKPVFIGANAAFVQGGAQYLEMPTTNDDEHYVVFGPTITLADGKHYAPVTMGPKVVYSQPPEENTSSVNLAVAESSEVTVVSLTTTNAYAISDMLSAAMRIEAIGGNRGAVISARLYINAGLEFEEVLAINDGSIPYRVAVAITNPVGIGDVLSLRVYWVRDSSGGSAPAVAVRGDIDPSVIRISSL